MAASFTESLWEAWARSDSLLCVSLDPDPARIPPYLAHWPDAILRVCTAIVDATADLLWG
jgi:orotidine-5'-phosphate decarboxylase